MPCRSDHMEPTTQERQRREASQHLVYVHKKLGTIVPPEVTSNADHIYGGSTDKDMQTLCSLLKAMDEAQRDSIVYNAKDPAARKLADWWEEHCIEDWKAVCAEAKANPTFDNIIAYAQMLLGGGYNYDDTAQNIAEATGLYFDFEDGTHVFHFAEGVIIMDGMDGLVAYKGEKVV